MMQSVEEVLAYVINVEQEAADRFGQLADGASDPWLKSTLCAAIGQAADEINFRGLSRIHQGGFGDGWSNINVKPGLLRAVFISQSEGLRFSCAAPSSSFIARRNP